MLCDITPKGRALKKAIEKGMIPKVDGAYDPKQFNKFWEIFTESLLESVKQSNCPYSGKS